MEYKVYVFVINQDIIKYSFLSFYYSFKINKVNILPIFIEKKLWICYYKKRKISWRTAVMEQEKDIVLRNAIGGYNKSDVNEYIASMAKEFSRREEEWYTEKRKLERALDDERAEKERFTKLCDELACQYYEVWVDVRHKREALEEEQKISSELKTSTAGLSGRIHELETELAAKNTALDEVNKKKQTEEVTDNAAVYDKLSERVDQIMAAANDSAHDILTDALARGDEIIAEAERKAEQIRADAVAQSEKEKGICQNTAVGYYDDVLRFASEIRDSLNKLMEEISAKKAEVEDKLEDARSFSDTTSRQSAKREPKKREEEKATLSSLDEKIEHFFKNTMRVIVDMKKK